MSGASSRSERGAAIAALAGRLRAAGCVFAEDEAAILIDHAEGDVELLEGLTRRRIEGEPLETLVGWVDFGGLRLSVAPGVFVPRQRTRRLAGYAIAEIRARAAARRQPPTFLEAFAGVAPVAASVRAAVPEARVLACERQHDARECAARNLGAAGLVLQTDVLRGLPEELRQRIDVIAAVPPYVPHDQLALMPYEAREHEPEAALSGGIDGLELVRALTDQATQWLRSDGCLLVELHRDQYPSAAEHAAIQGFASAYREGDGQTAVLELRLDESAMLS